ncbi:MAG TPA: TolC family protein [Thermoanaerobaculia bacterium]|nr:TolC family protein [Thermoanaerobaculia bacterium]
MPRRSTAQPPPTFPAGAPASSLGVLQVVKMTLDRDPNLAIVEARLAGSRGALLAASGKFDAVLGHQVSSSDARLPLAPEGSFERKTIESDLGLTELFRTGLSIQPAISLLRSEDPTSAPGTVNTGTVTVALRQPLLRGRGRDATVVAAERAAEREVTASGLDLSFTTTQRVQAVASQYWTLAGAQANLDVLRDSEAGSRDLLETTRKLIEADVTPAAEQVQLEANVAAKEAARIGGELALFQARQELGRQIGLEAAEIAGLPPPGDPFPGLAAGVLRPPVDARPFLATALSRRADLRAARLRLEEAAIQESAAANSLQPQLDLLLTPSYTGLVEGVGVERFLSPLYRNVPGAGVALALALSWPPRNRIALGGLEQVLAARRQAALGVDLLVKEIGANVPAALEAVVRDAAQLARATAAVRLFERAVENEQKKLRAGTSTLIDVMTQSDRLTGARQTEVSAHLALASALLALRFETGTLMASAGEFASLGYDNLTTPPTAEEPPP